MKTTVTNRNEVRSSQAQPARGWTALLNLKSQLSHRKFPLLLAALCFSAASVRAADALGAAFTYQGRLNDSGTPANGHYEFWFKVYNDPTSGTQQGVTVTPAALPVSNGLFTVTMDFGPGVFTGGPRWLEINVHNSTNAPGVGWVWLTPRQPLTPAPYALYAPNAGVAVSAATATTASGVASNAVTAPGIAPAQVVKTLNALKDDVTLAAGANMTLTPSGQTLTLATPTDWHVGGNSVGSGQFLGSLNNQAIAEFATVGGGVNNAALDTSSTVSGGNHNQAAIGATVGGGVDNIATGDEATVSGGQNNQAIGRTSTVGGGYMNQAPGYGGEPLRNLARGRLV